MLLRGVLRVERRRDAALRPLRSSPPTSTVLVTSSTRSTRSRSRSAQVSPAMPEPDDDDVGRGGPARVRGALQPAAGSVDAAWPASRCAQTSCPGVRHVGEDLERPAAGADEHGHVVDEAGRADPAGDGEQRLAAVPLGHVLQGLRVHEHEVVDQGQRLRARAPRGPPGGSADGPSTAASPPARSARRQAQRRLAVGRGEVDVAAAHRQPVGLAHRGHRDDVDREVEVAHHPPDEQQLLGVLLAEVGAVGPR